jgi:Holliday junction resolvasome RuvABC endonuclease subunit
MDDILIVGIDYSMNSPAMTLWCGDLKRDSFNVDNLDFFSYTSKVNTFNKFVNYDLKEWNSSIQRYKNLADLFYWKILTTQNKKLIKWKNVYIAIEGYSYGSNQSLIFNIAENTAILKYELWKNCLNFKIYQPTSVKKFITGKGNAKKEDVYKSICEILDFDLSDYLNIPVAKNTPIYDFSDSLSICYMLHREMLIRNNLEKNFDFRYDILTKKNEKGYSIIDENFITNDNEVKDEV